MSFKKHNWEKYGRNSEVIEIILRDCNGQKVDFFRCNNKEDYKRIIKIIEEKYNFSPD